MSPLEQGKYASYLYYHGLLDSEQFFILRDLEDTLIDMVNTFSLLHHTNTYIMYRWTSLYARDRKSKNRLAYHEFAYKKTNDNCKFEDRFQENGHFSIAHLQNNLIMRAAVLYTLKTHTSS